MKTTTNSNIERTQTGYIDAYTQTDYFDIRTNYSTAHIILPDNNAKRYVPINKIIPRNHWILDYCHADSAIHFLTMEKSHYDAQGKYFCEKKIISIHEDGSVATQITNPSVDAIVAKQGKLAKIKTTKSLYGCKTHFVKETGCKNCENQEQPYNKAKITALVRATVDDKQLIYLAEEDNNQYLQGRNALRPQEYWMLKSETSKKLREATELFVKGNKIIMSKDKRNTRYINDNWTYWSGKRAKMVNDNTFFYATLPASNDSNFFESNNNRLMRFTGSRKTLEEIPIKNIEALLKNAD